MSKSRPKQNARAKARAKAARARAREKQRKVKQREKKKKRAAIKRAKKEATAARERQRKQFRAELRRAEKEAKKTAAIAKNRERRSAMLERADVRLKKTIERIRVAIEKDMRSGILKGALALQAESQKRTPVDTGNLRGSAFTRPIANLPPGKVGYQVGYSAAYAIYVHENVGANFKVGDAKFLESPARTMQAELGDIVIQEFTE